MPAPSKPPPAPIQRLDEMNARALLGGGAERIKKQHEGGKLTATMSGKKIMLTDEKGGMATITTTNVYQSNGVIDVIDTVLMPS